MHKTIKFISCLIILLAVLTNTVFASYTPDIETYSDIYIVKSLDNDEVIISKNADKKCAPASLAAIATALVVMQSCKNLDEKVTVTQSACDSVLGTYSIIANLVPGEEISIRELLCCMLISGATDAAAMLAEYVGKTEGSFASKMNALAKSLGCKNTVFKNPHGLDAEGQYTTASDVALLVKKAASNTEFMKIVSEIEHTVPKTNKSEERDIYSTNYLLNYYYPGYYFQYAKGIKSGATDNSGKCVASVAQKDGYNYVTVVMKGPSQDVDNDNEEDNCALIDCRHLFEWVFDNIKLRTVVSQGQIISEIPVTNSWKTDHASLVADNDYSALVPSGIDEDSVSFKLLPNSSPEKINKSVKIGEVIAKAQVYYGNDVICTVNLTVSEDIHSSFLLSVFNVFGAMFRSTVFKIIIILAIICIAGYIYLCVKINRRKKMARVKLVTPPKKNVKDIKSQREDENK